MLATVLGVALVALGLAGVRYAPAIVEAQHRQGMTPLEDEETLETTDRVRATRGTAIALALVGVGCFVYGTGLI